MQQPGQKVWNVPNALTMLRLLLIPVFAILIANGRTYAALAVFLLAGATDLIDGYIARRYQQVTNFGKLMDPLADKLMVLTAMVALTLHRIAPWPAIALLLAKELVMVLGGVYLLRQKKVVVFSKPIGKIAQFVVFLGLVLCFFHRDFENLGYFVHLYVLWAGVALSLAALFYYGAAFFRVLQGRQGLKE